MPASAAQPGAAPDGRVTVVSRPRVSADVDMTSVVNSTEIWNEAFLHISRSFFVLRWTHTQVDAETGPVMPTVDPADIRGLGTTVL